MPASFTAAGLFSVLIIGGLVIFFVQIISKKDLPSGDVEQDFNQDGLVEKKRGKRSFKEMSKRKKTIILIPVISILLLVLISCLWAYIMG